MPLRLFFVKTLRVFVYKNQTYNVINDGKKGKLAVNIQKVLARSGLHISHHCVNR